MNVLHTLYRIKQSLDARIQPLTQQQVLLVLNQSLIRRPERSGVEAATTARYQPSSEIVSKLARIQQFGLTRSKDFQFVFGQVFTQHQKDPNYIIRLGEFENTLNEVMRDITQQDLKPIAESIINQYHQQDLQGTILLVQQYRHKLTNLKALTLQKNLLIKKLLIKKGNLQKSLQELKKVQVRITPIYRTLYSDAEIKIISEHVKGQHSQLKKYKFYTTLSTFLNNRIHEFEKNLRKVFIDNLVRIDEGEVEEMQRFLESLQLFKKESVPELLVYCFEHAMNSEIESMLSQQDSNGMESINSILLKIEPESCAKCVCQFLLVAENLLKNYQRIFQIFELESDCSRAKAKIKEYVMMFYQSFRNILCKPITNHIFLFSVLHAFCVDILGDEDIWCVIARETAQSIRVKLIEYKNSVVEDLNVELWNAVEFQYTTRLPIYQSILTLQLSYHQKIQWMLNKNLLNKLHSSSVPNSHILYSFFKFSKTFQKICSNIAYFIPLDSNFLLESVLELLQHFIVEIVRILIDYPPVACTLYQKHRQWYYYKATFALLKAKQPKKQLQVVEDEDKISLLCQSIRFIHDLVKGHEWVLMHKHDELTQSNIQKLRDLENVLTQLPSLAHHCFIKSKLKQIDLDVIGHNQWIFSPQSNFDTLLNSFDLQFLRSKESKEEFSRQFQYLFIDKICSQNPKTQDFQKMIQQFSVLKRKLESKGYKSAKQVQRFLVVCIGKEEDEIIKLLYEKKLIYSQRTIQFLYDLIKSRTAEKMEFWEVLTTICGGEPTEF